MRANQNLTTAKGFGELSREKAGRKEIGKSVMGTIGILNCGLIIWKRKNPVFKGTSLFSVEKKEIKKWACWYWRVQPQGLRISSSRGGGC